MYQTAILPNTDMLAEVGVFGLSVRDNIKSWNIASSDNNLWCKNADRVVQIKQCKVNIINVLKDHVVAQFSKTVTVDTNMWYKGTK